MPDPLFSTERPPHSRGRWLLGVGCVALLVQGSVFVFMHLPTSPDEAEYIALGRSLATSGTLQSPGGEFAKRLPLYPAMLAACYALFGEERFENAVLAVQLLLAWATTLMLAWTARLLADVRAGIVAGLIAAPYAPFLFLQASFLTENLLLCLLSASTLAYLQHVRRSTSRGGRYWLIVTALLLGAASLTRPNALLLVLPFAGDAWFRAGPWRARLARLIAIVLPAGIACAGWAVRNHACVGAYVLSTTGGLNFYLGHNPHYAEAPDLASADYAAFDRLRRETGQGEVEIDRRLYAEGWRYIASHPRETFLNLFRKLRVFHSPVVSMNAPTLLAIVQGAILLATWRAGSIRRRFLERRPVMLTLIASFLLVLLIWPYLLLASSRPWTSPAELVPLGLMALLTLRSRPSFRGLFIGLYATQLLAGILFIPLARIRWTVDGLLIVALAVGVSNLCRWIESPLVVPSVEARGKRGLAPRQTRFSRSNTAASAVPDPVCRSLVAPRRVASPPFNL